MVITTGNLLSIRSGVIMQQVNCKNAYGAGISGQISRLYPAVYQDYRASFSGRRPSDLFGSVRFIQVTPDLVVANAYTQFGFGNSAKTGIVYTDMNRLVNAIALVAKQFGHVYVPYRIGCGLAGGSWPDLCDRIRDLPVTVVKRPED